MAQEQEVAFDNWEEEAEEVVVQQAPTTTEEKGTSEKEKLEQQETVSEKKEEPVDPRKLFQDRLDHYKGLNENKFEEYFENARLASNNQLMKANTQVLKNDKDFALFAKKVAKVLNDKCEEEDLDNLEDEEVVNFFEEAVLLIYNQLPWKHMAGVHDKLKIVKKEKKQQQAKAKKRVKKEKIRQQQGTQIKQTTNYEDKKVEDDIFEGAGLITSKQVEDQLKNKPVEKVQAPKVEDEGDDDDFM